MTNQIETNQKDPGGFDELLQHISMSLHDAETTDLRLAARLRLERLLGMSLIDLVANCESAARLLTRVAERLKACKTLEAAMGQVSDLNSSTVTDLGNKAWECKGLWSARAYA